MKTIEKGLIIDNATTPPTCTGYIFNFTGHGAFEPSGRVLINGVLRDPTPDEIETHNRLLSRAELDAIKKHGRGCLYIFTKKRDASNARFPDTVGTWAATEPERIPVAHYSKSFHNMAGTNGRTDVWFYLDGARWHGVNIGDNDLLRIRKLKVKGGRAAV